MLKRGTGFTLVEIIIVLAVMALILAISAPVYRRSQMKNDLETGGAVIVQSLRRAQILSQAVAGDSDWGVDIKKSQITLFKGSSYLARDFSFDETYDLPSSLDVSGLSELVFNKFSGLPQANGTITLKIDDNEIKNITINSQGMVNY